LWSVPDFYPAFARIAPFAAYIALLAAMPLAHGTSAEPWLTVARGVVAAIVLVAFWRHYVELREAPRLELREWALAIGVGLLVFGAWIAFDSGWAVLGEATPFDPRRPDGRLDLPLTALRVFGMVAAVPVMEELFWRSFLMRWIDRRDFLSKDARTVGAGAFALSCGLFASEHALWFAGLLAGVAYGALYVRTGNLRVPILSHAITNATLATWILATGSWHLW
jgi:CAAX prenyl protease-like protein